MAELVHKLTETISTRRGDVLVPSLQAWALALDRSGFVDERKYDRLIKYNTGGNRALYIVVCMRSASKYVKMVVVKQGAEVHWWNDNDDKELESTIQIWVADKCQGIETEGLLRETVIAAWWGDELGEDINIDESGEETDIDEQMAEISEVNAQ